MKIKDLNNSPAGSAPSNYLLYKRSSFADGNTWGSYIDSGDEVVSGASGSVKFSTGNNVSSFSQLVVMQETAIPVTWQDFRTALQPDKTVRLYWAVQQTADVSHFILEKSTNGVDFQEFRKVDAQAGSGAFSYSATDFTPVSGENYYRLRQIDKDGRANYSAVRIVTVDALAYQWVVYPNPISAGNPLHISTDSYSPYRLLLYDAKGRIVFEKQLLGDATIENMRLSKGVYGYEISGQGKRVRGKLVVE